ncbi:tRNA-histidine guanylyltransferase 1-like [Datura stramonium]|uniref:tRNA-histidine guanylyltransferase 1-like n=1 Tax=Datura stramonium TaxID=4076 RepID=A0ABS8S105_DATST|nr:tRNA-histidine guanylyltransferase 1-like [Datura stramonium]
MFSFSEKRGFEKTDDEKALNLMNARAIKFRFEEGNHILPEENKGQSGLSPGQAGVARYGSRFCEDNGFQKPNDEQALKLMNSCALCFEERFSIVSEVVKKSMIAYDQVKFGGRGFSLTDLFGSSSPGNSDYFDAAQLQLPTCKSMMQLS